MRSLCSSLPTADARLERHPRGLGAPAPRARPRHLPGRPRPQRPGAGRAAGRRRPCRRRRRRSASSARRPPTRRHPAASRSPTRPSSRSPSRPRRRPPSCGDPRSTSRCRRCSTTRPCCGATPRSARGGSWPRPRCAASAPRSTSSASPRSRPRSSSSRPPSRARTSSRSTTSADPAYLAQSPQFYKQQLVGVFERVYEVGPVFRAEPHDTVRHLAEYRSLDVELGFIRDHRDVLAVLREVLAGMVASVRAPPRRPSRAPARGCRSCPTRSR